MPPSSVVFPLVIVAGGAGQHADVVLEAALLSGAPVAGVMDLTGRARSFGDVPMLGGADRLRDGAFIRAHALVPAAGDHEFRLQVLEAATRAGGVLGRVVHPAAIISPNASIGAGSVVLAGAIVATHATVGELCIINHAAGVDHDAILGPGVNLCPGARLAGAVQCREAAFIGMGAVVIQGRVVGRRAVVGAGAVVITDVPDGATVVGNPARPVARR